MKVTGKDGFLYKVLFGSVLVGGADIKVLKAGWYKIQSRAAENSGIPGSDPARTRGRAL